MYTTAESTLSAIITTHSLGGGVSHFSLEERDSGKGQTIPNAFTQDLHFDRKTE